MFFFLAFLSVCGTERWAVKTATDNQASAINLTSIPSSIARLTRLPAPGSLPISRIRPTEVTTYHLEATLIAYKREKDDSDYHLVLSDGERTMIAEIPSPKCVEGSVLKDQIEAARKTFDARFRATNKLKKTHLRVSISGVGFFDFPHGQTGVAPNAIELHPVTFIEFLP